LAPFLHRAQLEAVHLADVAQRGGHRSALFG
jgi:hypothetical protein